MSSSSTGGGLRLDDTFKVGNFLIEADDLVAIADKAKKNNLSLHIVGRNESKEFKNGVEIILLDSKNVGNKFRQDLYVEPLRGSLTEAILAVVERRS